MIPDPGLIAGACGILAALTCRLALRRQSIRNQAEAAALRSELESMVRAQHTECADQIARLGESLSVLERSAQSMDAAAKGGITRSTRSQAMQLLRSGMSPENAASAVGMGRREMHLLAGVSRILLTR
jgi:hypothetical protein